MAIAEYHLNYTDVYHHYISTACYCMSMHVIVNNKVTNPAMRTPRAQLGHLVAPVVSRLFHFALFDS